MRRRATARSRWSRKQNHLAQSLRCGVAIVFALSGASVVFSHAATAEPVVTEEQRTGSNASDDSAAANAGNGGTAMSTSGGEVQIGEIVTGENSGNTIITGNISGSADISGGEIAYPTDVDVSLNNAALTTDASGGDGNEASATDETESDANKDGETDVKIINENDNQSSAVITTAP